MLLLITLVLAGTISIFAQFEEYTPPHSKPGPATDRIFYSAFHTDIAASALKAGDIDLYIFSLKTEAARALRGDDSVRIYGAPATSISLILNPAPAPEGQLNPFSLKEVRQALQFLVDREFAAQEIYKGLAEPMLTYVSPFDYDHLSITALLKERNIVYDPELAKQMVQRAMTEAGATLEGGIWHFNGRPIQLKFIIRVEDERREVGDLIRSDLGKLGFSVLPAYLSFGPAILKVYSTDPALFDWHLYTEGWGRGAAERYDYGTANQMAAPWIGNMPGWQEVGFYQYENAGADELGKKLFRGDFADAKEREQIYRDLVALSLDESVRIWIGTVINSFPATTELQGVTEDLVSGPKSLWTMRDAYIPGKDTLKVGSLWVWTSRTTWNPVGGFGDIYSVDIWNQVHDPPMARDPFSGIPRPFRVDYTVDTAGPQGKLNVPDDAFRWDAAASRFQPVGAGVTATSKVTYDYSRYFQSKWHHGQPITMADVIYSIFQSFDMAFNEDKSKIEVALAVTSKPYLDTIRAFRILDDNRLEIYADYWHFVSDYIAEYSSPSGVGMPWEMLAAMDRLVFQERRAAYSQTAAQRFTVPWISLVLSKDSSLMRRALLALQDEGAILENVFQVGGSSLITADDAQERYAAALDWIKSKDHSVVSNGPYVLEEFNPAAQFAELLAFRDPTYPFKPGDFYQGSTPLIDFSSVDAGSIAIGSDYEVRVGLDGPGVLGLNYILFDPVTAQILARGEAEALEAGRFRIGLSKAQTSNMIVGLYQMFLTAYSDSLASPSQRQLDIEALVGVPNEAAPTPTVRAGETPTTTEPPAGEATSTPIPQPTSTPESSGGGCGAQPGSRSGDLALVLIPVALLGLYLRPWKR